LADIFKGTGVERLARFLDRGRAEDTEPLDAGLPVKDIYLSADDLQAMGDMNHGPFAPGAEGRFKAVAWALVDMGTHPTPTLMNAALGHNGGHNLNGRECRWLRNVVAPMRRPRRGYSGPLCDRQCCSGR
jgi:hypothetical protein